MKTRLFFALVAGWIYLGARAQISPLKPGDKIPDIYLGKFLNEPEKSMKLSDLHAKLTILDFWNNHCTVCLYDMPKLDSIQKKYGPKVQFLAITKNTESEVNDLFSRIKIKKPGYPFIVGDTTFNRLFPHNGDPLHVWIDQEGTVVAITFDFETNFKTVDQYLSGRVPNLLKAQPNVLEEDYPLLSEKNSGMIPFATDYSILFKAEDIYATSMQVRVQPDFISVTNAPFLLLYSIAYSPLTYAKEVNFIRLEHDNRILLEVHDKSEFFEPTKEDEIANWVRKNRISYEMKTSSLLKGEKYRIMRADLRHYLKYSAKIENRKSRCLALVVTDWSQIQALKRVDSTIKPQIQFGTTFSIHKMSLSSFVMELIYANRRLNLPIVNRTEIPGDVSLTLNCNLSDLGAVNHELSKYGLRLTHMVTEIPMLVLRDRK